MSFEVIFESQDDTSHENNLGSSESDGRYAKCKESKKEMRLV